MLRVVVAIALVSALLGAAAAGDAAPSVTIRQFRFGPPILAVAAGTPIVWINRDDEPHLIVGIGVGAPPLLKSPPLDTDDSFTFTFAAPGTYRYFCSIHPQMQGSIIVR